MDDSLKRLLDAEQRAEALVTKASEDRDRLIAQALEEVKTADARFRARVPELRESFKRKAEERAEQAIAEIRRRHNERRALLEKETAKRRDQAVTRGLEMLLSPAEH
jgi:V/A-type H+-transporting ATPase subunit G/H